MEGLETAFNLVLPHRIEGKGFAPSHMILPLPLDKGKGIKGIGLP